MATYILLSNYTDQGIRNVKESPKRLDAVRELAKQFGAQIKDVHLTFGAYDFVLTVEAPDDAAMAKFNLAVASRGNVRTTTLKAFSEADFRKIVSSLP
jgi:uncharacterized protein with GYD domain